MKAKQKGEQLSKKLLAATIVLLQLFARLLCLELVLPQTHLGTGAAGSGQNGRTVITRKIVKALVGGGDRKR